MTVDAPQLRSAAALLCAVPWLACRLTTVAGRDMVVGDVPDAAMCAHGFRSMVVQWPFSGVDLPDVSDIAIEGLDPATGMAHGDRRRWFVSPMPAASTIACLKAAQCVSAPCVAMVRDDEELGVSVVCIYDQADASSPDALNDVALDAYAAALVSHLVATADPSSPSESHPDA